MLDLGKQVNREPGKDILDEDHPSTWVLQEVICVRG